MINKVGKYTSLYAGKKEKEKHYNLALRNCWANHMHSCVCKSSVASHSGVRRPL